VYGSGTNTRDWIHVLDHCRAIDAVMSSGKFKGEVYNIGAGEEHSVLEISEIVLETLGKPKDLLQHVADRPGHVVRHAVDTAKIRAALGWAPREDFREGIRQTVLWYKNNPAWWKKLLDRQIDFARSFGGAKGRGKAPARGRKR
jgi:dTDP-glucose 4,6-dehydratase